MKLITFELCTDPNLIGVLVPQECAALASTRLLALTLFAAHPCNMKEFKLYVGTNEDNMAEILHSSLKNDPIPETFSISHANCAGVCFPTRYVKIVPLS